MAETKKKESREYLATLAEYRWDGEVPEVATRVEFRAFREGLRRIHDIDTLPDLLDKLSDLTRWVCYEWFRVTERVPNHENTESEKTSKVWEQVQEAFAGRAIQEATSAP